MLHTLIVSLPNQQPTHTLLQYQNKTLCKSDVLLGPDSPGSVVFQAQQTQDFTDHLRQLKG
jgi:hypothetical protein